MILKLKNREVQIDRFHVFILAISLVKIFLMCVCTSDYQEKMFIPFLTHFVVGGVIRTSIFLKRETPGHSLILRQCS